jgi:transcriptional regulator with GAF, ATPase, and Fis domain
MTYLLASAEPELARQGRAELEAVFAKAGSVRAAAEQLGVAVRTVIRWAERAGVPTPDGRGKDVSDAEVRAALRKHGSAWGAAQELGVSHTLIQNRAKKAGIKMPDGRTTRHRKG